MTSNYKIYGTCAPCNLSKFWFTPYHIIDFDFCTLKIHEGLKPKNLQVTSMKSKKNYLQWVN